MLQPNTTFANRYFLEKKIGVGGFSEVWKARDQMAEDSIVAVKIYAAEKGMDEFGLKQFRREYANMLNISHEHLVTARHFDIWQSRPYLIMPFMEGGSLYQKMMEQGPLEEKEIAEVVLQLSKGLSFLHLSGILHQDIKPENVLLDARGNHHLTDFGISTRMRSTLRKTAAKEERSMTVSYAPPERFTGRQKPTEGGDIFSLGVLMYEMAAGELPWMGAGGVVLLSGTAPLELPEKYSSGLTRLINECIQINPDERPTAAEIVKNCENYLSFVNWGLDSLSNEDDLQEDRSRRTKRMPVPPVVMDKTETGEEKVKSEDIDKDSPRSKVKLFYSPFSFSGRIRRLEYGLSLIFFFIIYFIISGLGALIMEYSLDEIILVFLVFFYLPLFYFILAQGAKRCHDRGYSGWMQFIPFFIIVMIFMAGDKNENTYGYPPK